MTRKRKTPALPDDTTRAGRQAARLIQNSQVVRPGGAVSANTADMRDKIDARASLWEQMKACDLTTDDGAKAYDRLEAEYDVLDAEIEASPFDSMTSGWEGGSASYVRDRPLASDQTFRGAVQSLGLDQDDRNMDQLRDEAGRELSFGAVLRNAMADNRLNIVDSMSGGSDAGGGYLVPSILTADIIDLARNKARVLEAGARVVPMANRHVEVPTWETDPVPAWRAEEAAIAEDDGELGSVELDAKSLAVLVKASRELLEDTNVDQLLLEAFGQAFALKLDVTAMYGTGSNTPAGLKGIAGVTKTALDATPTWDTLVDSVGRLRDKNYDPNASITADRTARTLAKLKETGTGAYVQRPDYLDDVPLLTTGQVPTNLTQASNNTTTDVFTGDWSKLYVGIRTNLTISRLVERYADTGQVGFVAWFRGDIVPARPAAFDIVTGVRP